MDADLAIVSVDGGCCSCSCYSATTWRRSVKRRVDSEDGGEDEMAGDVAGDRGEVVVAARVEFENEVAALREMVMGQQQTIDELIEELEEERKASASATSEAMSMILRLQREKADVQMDARNFKRFAEEQMVHDQEELVVLEEALMKREEALRSMAFEVQACRHRLLNLGIDPDMGTLELSNEDNAERETPLVPQFDDVLAYEYPPLKCMVAVRNEETIEDLDKYAFVESMCVQEEELDELEMLRDGNVVLEKDVVEHLTVENCKNGGELNNTEKFPVSVDRPLGDDEMSDRVYTVVAEHAVPSTSVSQRYEKENLVEFWREDEGGSVDIKKLYVRLQALEEDRESMRKAIITMRTEKAQLALLKEMAQQLQKDAAPEKLIVKKSWIEAFSSLVLVKWLTSYVLWRKKVPRSKYTFGLSNANVGLLLILDKPSQISNWRCLSKIQR